MAFPDGWGRKQKITIDNTKVPGAANLTNFPFLITLDHLNAEIVDAGSNSALNGGGDIRFSSDADGVTQLACEIQHFITNATAGSRKCTVWVKVPTVAYNTDTDIYIWYKKAAESQPAVTNTYGRNAVWSDYDFVSHDGVINSTGGEAITQVNAPDESTNKTPWGSDAITYNGTDEYSYAAATDVDFTDTQAWSLSAWFNYQSTADFQHIVAIQNADESENLMITNHNKHARICLISSGEAGSANNFSNETDYADHQAWNHVMFTNDDWTSSNGTSTEAQFYLNGVDIMNDAANAHLGGWGAGTNDDATNGRITLGARGDPSNYTNGYLAEVKLITNVELTEEWYLAERNNQYAPDTFATAGTPESGSSSIDVELGVASENNIAGSFGSLKTKSLALVFSIEAPDTISSLKTLALNAAAEIEAVLSLSKSKEKGLVAPIELDVAQLLGKQKALGFNDTAEIDLSGSLNPGYSRTIDPAVEADSATAFISGKSAGITAPSESDTAGSLSSEKLLQLGLVGETDLARTLTSNISALISVAQELDAPLALTKLKSLLFSGITETDSSNPVGVEKIRSIAATSETELSGTLTPERLVELGVVSELNQGAPLSKDKHYLIGLVTELDLARQIGTLTTKAISQVVETNLANSFASSKGLSIGGVSEIDTISAAMVAMKSMSLGEVSEIAIALSFGREKLFGLGVVSEIDLASLINREKNTSIGQVSEIQIAGILLALKSMPILQAAELDQAAAIEKLRTAEIGIVAELDAARLVTAEKTLGISQVVETETPNGLSSGRTVTLVKVSELNAGFAFGLNKMKALSAATSFETASEILGLLRRAMTGEKPGMTKPTGSRDLHKAALSKSLGKTTASRSIKME